MVEWKPISMNWGYYIDPRTLKMFRVRDRIPVGAIILSKFRITNPSGKRVIQTEFILAERNGLRTITDKNEASVILGTQIINHIRREAILPSNTDIIKKESNGDLELRLKASEYDVFHISLSEWMLEPDRNQVLL